MRAVPGGQNQRRARLRGWAFTAERHKGKQSIKRGKEGDDEEEQEQEKEEKRKEEEELGGRFGRPAHFYGREGGGKQGRI